MAKNIFIIIASLFGPSCFAASALGVFSALSMELTLIPFSPFTISSEYLGMGYSYDDLSDQEKAELHAKIDREFDENRRRLAIDVAPRKIAAITHALTKTQGNETLTDALLKQRLFWQAVSRVI